MTTRKTTRKCAGVFCVFEQPDFDEVLTKGMFEHACKQEDYEFLNFLLYMTTWRCDGPENATPLLLSGCRTFVGLLGLLLLLLRRQRHS